MLQTPKQPIIATHWGTYRVTMENNRPAKVTGIHADLDPSPIGSSIIGALDDSVRIGEPAVRASYLEGSSKGNNEKRGAEPFVAVSWQTAIEIAATELDRVRCSFGNEAIFGGSYGWASAGRFHHAQSQIHRFLSSIGGFTTSVQNYSFAAGATILPYVIGNAEGLGSGHTMWPSIIENTQTLIMFGGTPHKNAQVNAGGVLRHRLMDRLQALHSRGADLILVSPIKEDLQNGFVSEWHSPRPGTDVAFMLGIAHTLVKEELFDGHFLARYTVGFERFRSYLMGEHDGVPKCADWASNVCEIPADRLRGLAHRMANTRTMIMMAWSLQRADHGEQPYWMTVTLAAMLGQIGLPGGGFGFGYGASNGIGEPVVDTKWPSLDQGLNAIEEYIPVARIADMLLNPRKPYDFNGKSRTYPEIKLVYWAGGNPFHHHQDINKLLLAWRKPDTIIVHDSWWNPMTRHADIVFPVATSLERNDIACAARECMLAASHKVAEPFGSSRSDYEIFSDLSRALGAYDKFTEGLDEEGWLRRLYSVAAQNLNMIGERLPSFSDFWERGLLTFVKPDTNRILLKNFRVDPERHALATPSGRIEIYSETIEQFGYEDCPPHPTWIEPKEWLGAKISQRFPLHLISNQPKSRLHSQYDNGIVSKKSKISGREPIMMNIKDAKVRGIQNGDIVCVFNDRGKCLAGAIVSDRIRPGVVQISTGAWYDPEIPGQVGTLDKHGNPNVLTRDEGASKLSQGPSAQSCLVEVELLDSIAPPVSAYDAPKIV